METKAIVENLVKSGATLVKNIIVKNVTIAVKDGYTRVALTLDKPVKGMVQQVDSDGVVTYKEGMTDVIFTSTISLGSVLKSDERAAFAVNQLNMKPDGYQVILSRATIDVVNEAVKAETDYTNPFSTRENKTVTRFEHDTILHHVVSIKLSERANMLLDKMALAMLGL